MLRSGCVSKRRRAGSPTIIPPSGSMLTTEGQSVLPDGPGIHLGCPVCASTYATRLLVVPRSIPTILPMKVFSNQFSVLSNPRPKVCKLQQLLLDVYYQIPDIRTAIQQVVKLAHYSLLSVFLGAGIQRLIPFPGR